jgi:hypothetical protein
MNNGTTFQVDYNCCAWLNNANDYHVAFHGTSYPHHYQNDGNLTYVTVT